jgi:tetratricopeptide (TPR) repeat protein
MTRELIRGGQFKEAEALLHESIVNNPGSQILAGLLAEVYFKTDRLDESERCIAEILLKNPSDVYTLQRKGDILAKKRKYSEALDIFLDLYNNGNSDPFLIKRIAKTCYLKCDYTRALEYITVGIRAYPERHDFYYLSCDIYQAQGNFNEAMASIESALRLDPENRFYYSKKLSLRAAGKNVSSESIEEMLELSGGEDPQVLRVLARKLKQEGNFAKAVEVLKKSIEFDNGDFAKKELAFAYYKNKEMKKAFDLFISLQDGNFRDNIFVSCLIASAMTDEDKNRLLERMKFLAAVSGYKNLWPRIKKISKKSTGEKNS